MLTKRIPSCMLPWSLCAARSPVLWMGYDDRGVKWGSLSQARLQQHQYALPSQHPAPSLVSITGSGVVCSLPGAVTPPAVHVLYRAPCQVCSAIPLLSLLPAAESHCPHIPPAPRSVQQLHLILKPPSHPLLCPSDPTVALCCISLSTPSTTPSPALLLPPSPG